VESVDRFSSILGVYVSFRSRLLVIVMMVMVMMVVMVMAVVIVSVPARGEALRQVG